MWLARFTLVNTLSATIARMSSILDPHPSYSHLLKANHPTEWLLRAMQLSGAIVTTLMELDVYFGRKAPVLKSPQLQVMMYMMNQWLLGYVCHSAPHRHSEMWFTWIMIVYVNNEMFVHICGFFCLLCLLLFYNQFKLLISGDREDKILKDKIKLSDSIL